ncbi:hypothetical protein [Actinomadura sp. HBU206391]|uniref:hypothetical protein n=1 Tax=Actinomadura sp. HBU206391 TaxID=2731692 RepID=UPI00164F5041|nr:hypothetical protein [Actinomadura sp. HBU206391]MBC6458077.1 hypothetical protein [Actinomadura sp. HBU206391]
MAAHQPPATGMDFWAALGVAPEAEDRSDVGASQGTPVPPGEQAAPAGPTTAPPAPEPKVGQPGKRDERASLFSAFESADENGIGESGGAAPAASQAAARTPMARAADVAPQHAAPQAPAQPPAQAPAQVSGQAPARVSGQSEAPADARKPKAQRASETSPDPRPQPPIPQAAPEPPDPARPRTPPAADPAWLAAERIAHSLRPQISGIWIEVLTRYTHGDRAMAGRVYDVLSGTHLLGELWRDKHVDEVHIQGTEVTVCGAHGVHQVPGFPSLAAAHRAIETIEAAPERTGAVVSRIGGSVVVSRRRGTNLDATALLAGGILTEDQLAQVRHALGRTRAVTVTGPAARIVVRALASLIPAGSRVFLAAYATLPAGCVTAAHPMEADYVVGVRPGAVAEEMAAAGQVGALIANPETPIPAALRFAVSGQSASPGKLTPLT